MTYSRMTFACPAAHVADANNLAMVLAYSEADALTYRDAAWRDAAGNLYAVASSMVVVAGFVANATSPLVRPGWDTTGVIDMDAAARAQALVLLADPADTVTDWSARPDRLLAYPHEDVGAALAALGVSPPDPDPV